MTEKQKLAEALDIVREALDEEDVYALLQCEMYLEIVYEAARAHLAALSLPAVDVEEEMKDMTEFERKIYDSLYDLAKDQIHYESYNEALTHLRQKYPGGLRWK